jgi:carbohydrate-selective porin OprB
MNYIHKYEVAQQYGGPEEGGWWYNAGDPVDDWKLVMVEDEDNAYEICRALNSAEYVRRDEKEQDKFTDVLSYRSQFFAYDVSDSPVAESFPKERPYYE